jgi:hypothetical protein
MNPFMLAGGVLMFLASSWSAYHTDWRMALVYLCFAVANTALGVK